MSSIFLSSFGWKVCQYNLNFFLLKYKFIVGVSFSIVVFYVFIFWILATAVDNIPPVIRECPDDIQVSSPTGANSAFVSWTEPTATDNSGNTPFVRRTHTPNSAFFIGTTVVTYTFSDRYGNSAACSFDVTVSRKNTFWSYYHFCVTHLFSYFYVDEFPYGVDQTSAFVAQIKSYENKLNMETKR